MTEDDLEESVEVMPKNQLAVMVSDLPKEKSTILMGKFATFFADAELWAKKAKAIKVTHESQKAIMEQARQGRLFIRKVRLDVEKCRKELKEQSLREGKAIDKVANFLKDALEPIEVHLDRQEHFLEYKEAEKEALIQAEVERKMEEERLAEEKRKEEELEVTRRENERLRKEAEANETKNKALKEAQEKANEESANKVAEASRRAAIAENELRLKKQAELKSEADKQRQELILKSGSDIQKLTKLHEDLMNIDWPECTTIEGKKARLECNDHNYIGIKVLERYLKTKQQTEEEL